MDENNKLSKPIKMGPGTIKKPGIAGLRQEVAKSLSEIDSNTVQNRICIEFDDSGSMGGQPLADAKAAVGSFCAACNAMDTSISIVFMNNREDRPLVNNYGLVQLAVNGISDANLGGTPLYDAMDRMLQKNITRGIIFSDGQSGDSDFGQINKAKEKGIPIDTVYIGHGDSPELEKIAKETGGIYIRFADNKSFAKNLKYLAPKYRPLLANAELKERISRGETI